MMKRIRNISIKVAGVLILLYSVSFAQGLPDEPSAGGRVFFDKGCAACHGFKGTGSKISPDLGKVELWDTQLDLAAQIWNQSPIMIAEMERSGIKKAGLTAQEFIEITAYLYFLKFFDDPGNPQSGVKVFGQKGCSLCHSNLAGGEPVGPRIETFPSNISPVFLSKAVWNHSVPMIANMAQIGMKWPDFEGHEMMDLLEYIKSRAKGAEESAFVKPGSPTVGRRVFETRGCKECHSAQGEGPEGGIDLGNRARKFYTSLTRIVSSMWNKGPVVIVRMAQTQCCIQKFTSDEMADLLAYLYFLHYIDEPGNARNGEKLFNDLACAECHGRKGKEAPLRAGDLSKYRGMTQTEIVAGMWNSTTEMQKAMTNNGIPWPTLKKGQMADLIEYIRYPR